jgi:hypothetical protein
MKEWASMHAGELIRVTLCTVEKNGSRAAFG